MMLQHLIVEKDSIDMNKVYLKSRYDKGEAAYLNCPMTEEEFDRFYEALIAAETVPLKEFEKEIFFEGCMPVEVMASRGRQTLVFGPMKPVGLEDPKTGKRHMLLFSYVKMMQRNVIQYCRFPNAFKMGTAKEVLQLIPGLENAEIVRYGVMHRNTFINSPNLLRPTYQYKQRDDLFFAGQNDWSRGIC